MQPLDVCYEKWEQIVADYSKYSGQGGYSSYFQNLRHYAKLIREFNLIRTSLLILYFEVDSECLKFLASKGYKIDIRPEFYELSLAKAMNKSANILTKIESKYKEIERAAGESKGSNKSLTFDEIIANLSAALPGVAISDDIKLIRYNEYNKIIKKQKENEKQHGRIRKA